jgi:hemolysin activation/secretion protein
VLESILIASQSNSAIQQVAPQAEKQQNRSPFEVAQKSTQKIAQVPPAGDPLGTVKPNGSDRLSPLPPTTVPPQETPGPVLAPPASTETVPADATTLIDVKQIRVTGSTIFKPADFAVYTKQVEGRNVALAELQGVADSITKLYLSKGYINSRAVLADQKVVNGQVEIRAIEGSVEKIEVTGNKRIKEAYVRDRVALGITNPLRQDELEDKLRLLRIDPAFETLEATLKPGSGLGKSILTVKVKEAKSFYGGLTSDNLSPPVVGSERYGAYVGARSPLGLGDELTFSYNRTTSGGANLYDFNYRVPVNAMNGTIALRYAPSDNRITDDEIGSIFDIEGKSQLYELTYRQPIVRSFKKEVALSLGFAIQNGDTTINGFNNLFDSESRVRVLKFGQDMLSRDTQGFWSGRSLFNFGLNVFNADSSNSRGNTSFFSWTGQLQRVQRLSPDNFLIGQLDVQLSPSELLPSQQFIIGGGQSVRGYRQNARFGDSGVRFSLEDRFAVMKNPSGSPVVQLAPFFDIGAVWNSGDSSSIDEGVLASAGLGLIVQPIPGLNMRFDYAVPFRSVREKNDNLQDKAFYFSLNYQLF